MDDFEVHSNESVCRKSGRLGMDQALWYRFLPQGTMTLNMLRRSRLNPEISAYEQVDSIHNFERTPLLPLVCKVQVHDKKHKQLTYAPYSGD